MSAFISPILDEVISGSYNVVFTAVPDAVAYQLELSVNGGADWTMLDDSITTAPDISGNIVWPWDTTTVPDTEGVQLRARAVFAGFDPSDISGAIIDVRADEIVGLDNGDPVNQWDDLSGNDNHLITPGNPPAYISVDTEHDWPAVRFTRSLANYFQGPDLSTLTVGEGLIVVRIDTDPPPATGNHESYPSMWQFGTHEFDSHYPWAGDGVIYEGFGSTVRKTVGNPVPSLAVTRRYRVLSSAAFTVWLDAVQLFTSANTVGFNSTPYIGRSRARHFDGFVFAFILFNRALTTQERADIEAWASRYQVDRADEPDTNLYGDPFYSDLFDILNIQPPETPTISIDSITKASATLVGSAFVDPDLNSHIGSQWQVQEVGGDWSAPLIDTGEDAVNLLTYPTGSVLEIETQYEARVRYRDSEDTWSEYSNPVSFFTLPEWVVPPAPDDTDWVDDSETVVTWDSCPTPPITDWSNCE